MTELDFKAVLARSDLLFDRAALEAAIDRMAAGISERLHGQRPVFVTVLHAQPPAGEALEREVQALTRALAAVFARAPERVHVQIAPAASGRQAFGGMLLP